MVVSLRIKQKHIII